MFKNFLKSTVVATLILNPLISSAEPRIATDSTISENVDALVNARRVDLRTAEGKQMIFNFFTSLSKSDQQEYLATTEQSQQEVKKMLESLEMKIQVASKDRTNNVIKMGAGASLSVIALGLGMTAWDMDSKHYSRAQDIGRDAGVKIHKTDTGALKRNWKQLIDASRSQHTGLMAELEQRVLKSKFHTRLLGSSYALFFAGFFSSMYYAKQVEIENLDIRTAEQAIAQLKQDLNTEIEMIATLKVYSKTN